jgi:hypothetical protein
MIAGGEDVVEGAAALGQQVAKTLVMQRARPPRVYGFGVMAR